MVHRYIPILRWKRGERVALSHLTQAGRQDVVPLFVLGTDRYVGRAATQHRPEMPPAVVLVDEIQNIWGAQEFYLDAAELTTRRAAHHPILDIAARARANGLNLIPATRPGAPMAYQQAVNNMVNADRRGVALRVDLQALTSAVSWIGQWPNNLGDTDLIADFADNVGVVLQLGGALDHAFQTLHAAGQWRTVAVGGSSMPDDFTGFRAGLHQIPRNEILLWSRLANLGLPYRIDYSDYTTVPVNPPPQGIAWGFPINARYTLPNEFLICRGVSTTGYNGVSMDQQLIGHARNIAAFPNRGPLANSWGDSRINDVAAGNINPGNLEHWVQIGVNRHIELTRANVA